MHGLECVLRTIEVRWRVPCATQCTVQVVAPRVIGADERACAGMSASLGAEARAAVTADIEQRAQLAVLTADDDEGFLKDVDREKVAGIGCLAAVPDAMPVPHEQALHVTREECRIAIETLVEGVARAVGRDCPGDGVVQHAISAGHCLMVSANGSARNPQTSSIAP